MTRLALLLMVLITYISAAAEQSPYAGEELRSIKSLSEQEIESLRRGDGMGFAKLAELNHYPGPKHVLEISGDLELTPSQLAATESLYEEMHSNAVALGAELLEAELALDRKFEEGSVSPESLDRALRKIADIRARLRYVHLESHLRQKELLTPKQIVRYDELRGYGKNQHHSHDHSNAHN